MKKILVFLGFMLLLTTPLFAQRAAVMEFKAGDNISQADVDGLSGIFTTYFRPAGFTMVERTQIDRVISEQGFQKSSIIKSDMIKIGKILNLSMIVIGDINVVRGKYNVFIRVIDVESGAFIAGEAPIFSGNNYLNSMKELAQRLAEAARKAEAARREQWLRGRKIGNLIWSDRSASKMNWSSAKQYCEDLTEGGYSDWRLPTISELRTTIKNCSGSQSGGSCRVSDSCLSGNCWSKSCYCDDRSNNGGYYSKLGDPDGVWLWSSSSRADYTDYAWFVYFKNGNVYDYSKSNLYYVRCVR